MRIDRQKLDLALAEQCKSARDLRATLSATTITRIRQGREVGTRTAGKLARALDMSVEQLMKQEGRNE